MRDLAGKVAVVTGGGSGIGRGMALAFAEAGMHVVLADVDVAAAESVRGEVEARGRRGLAVETDVLRHEAVAALAERAWAEFGGVHLLCNNAGVVTFGTMDTLADADWQWVLGVNLLGVIHGLQAFLPRLRAQPGAKHVVNTASIAGVAPYEGIGPYVASKYAVVGLSESLRLEGAAWGLGCTVVCPGNVRTRIVQSARNRQTELGGPRDVVEPDVQRLTDAGVDPEHVGRLVRDAVLGDRPYVFTHRENRELVERRFAAMLDAFGTLDGTDPC
jgi:NAD(P)-dependent dehydrogenase (short-subunit alcohol dehydrogenase family)